MPNLYISHATSLSFKYNKAAGNILYGQQFDADYLFTNPGFRDYYGCTKYELRKDYACQPFLCSDSTQFQFRWTYDDDGQRAPMVNLFDDTGTEIIKLEAQRMDIDNDGNEVFNVDVDFQQLYDDAVINCPDCFTVNINTVNADTSDTTCWNDEGDANLDVGGSNTGATEVTTVRTGTVSTKITADATPVLIDRRIWHCNNISLTANTTYYVEVWIRENTADPSFSGGEVYEWDLTDFSDATVWSEGKVQIGTLYAKDAWHKCWMLFRTGADVTGDLWIRTVGTPAANGVAYFDDLLLRHATGAATVEAISQELCVDNHDCTIGITYGGDVDGFGIDYTHALSALPPISDPVNFIRVPGTYHQFRMDDPEREDDENSARTAISVQSASQKIRTLRTAALPEFMVEKIALAVKHQNVQLNGIAYICLSDGITPEWGDELDATARLEIDMRLEDYDYQLNNC